MRRIASGWFAIIALAGILATHTAHANCARPVGYGAEVMPAGVVVMPVNFDGRGCPDREGLVRQNVMSGEVVRIDTCGSVDGGADERPFLDACVPPGTYRYGFARPYECVASACSTDFFVDVTVTAPPAAGCVAPARTKLPAAPWSSNRTICSYGNRAARMGIGVILVVLVLAGALAFGLARMLRKNKTPS